MMRQRQTARPDHGPARSRIGKFLALGFIALVAGWMAASPVNAGGGKDPSPVLRIVAFGDSLTAGYNLPPDASFPAQLQAALRKRGHNVEIINAGVSADTTAAGLARFDWAVPEGAHGAILELGANDALRGIDPAQATANLEKIIAKLKARKMPVLLVGMQSPGNWGEDYAKRFNAMYPALAAKHKLRLYPFFLEGVALRPELNLSDGMHPNGKGVGVIVARILPFVEDLIKDIRGQKSGS